MANEIIGLIVILSVLLLMFFRIPIVIAMVVPACIGIIYMRGWDTLLAVIHSIVWSQSFHYTLSTIPLFVLMGQFLYASGITKKLFETSRLWFGHLKGGLGIATIGASALFATSAGSSVATTGTMGIIATKEMLKGGYSKSLTGGTIVAGGALGILIPPSTTFIVYAMITEQSVGKLLTAGIIPGILLTLFFMITIYISVRINPKLVQNEETEKASWNERLRSLPSNLWVALLFIIVMGGIFFGLFTATEAAGVGALGALLIGLFQRRITKAAFNEAIVSTLKTTGFMFAIVLGAFILNYVLVLTRFPNMLADVFVSTNLSETAIFLLIVLLFIILGAIMDSLAMMVVTIPVLMPVLEVLGYNMIWFGVLIVLLVELALITPPVGMNVFVLKGVAKELDLVDIFKGAFLFIIPIFTLIILIYIFPEIALYLPNMMD